MPDPNYKEIFTDELVKISNPYIGRSEYGNLRVRELGEKNGSEYGVWSLLYEKPVKTGESTSAIRAYIKNNEFFVRRNDAPIVGKLKESLIMVTMSEALEYVQKKIAEIPESRKVLG